MTKEKIIKRVIRAAGQRQAVLVIGDWDTTLIQGLRENQNSVTQSSDLSHNENSFTRIIINYNDQAINFSNPVPFFKEIRKLLLPTGLLIVSANSELSFLEKIFNFLKKNHIEEPEVKKIKPKQLQNNIHDNGFLIDGYYGYPEGHLLMIAQIQDKEVSTLFTSEKQETIQY